MRTNLIFMIILASSLTTSCLKDPPGDCCAELKNRVVKFKEGNEYLADHVYVMLNKDKSGIVGYPDKDLGNNFAVDYYNGYYLNKPDFGINTGYLSLTIHDFEACWDTLSTNTMDRLLIEDDPYSEYYYDEDNYLLNNCPECVGKDTSWNVLDTVKFHRLVDYSELEKYLIRVK